MKGADGADRLDGGTRAQEDLCAFDVIEASAWVNRMPSIGRKERPVVNVVAETEPADQIRALERTDSEKAGLVLSVVPGRAPLQAGMLSWRMYEPEEALERIVIQCSGAEKALIQDIESVY